MNKFEQAWNYLTNRQVKVKEKESVNEMITALQNLTINKIIYNTSDKTCQVIIGEDILVGNNIELTEDLRSQLKTGNYNTVKELLAPKQEITEDTKEEIVNLHLDAFEGNDDFEVVGNSVFFKGIKSIEIPKSIVACFIELIDKMNINGINAYTLEEDLDEKLNEEYETMKAFTLKLLANPIQESRDNLMEYVKKFNVKMSSSGNLVMFRNIVSKGNDNKGYTEFISKEFFRVKG